MLLLSGIMIMIEDSKYHELMMMEGRARLKTTIFCLLVTHSNTMKNDSALVLPIMNDYGGRLDLCGSAALDPRRWFLVASSSSCLIDCRLQ